VCSTERRPAQSRHCTIEGSFQQVGVLVVASDVSVPSVVNAAELTTTIAAHLVQTGAATRMGMS
jgi:hypothetical protein